MREYESGRRNERGSSNEISAGRNPRDGKVGEEMEDQNQEDSSHSHEEKKGPVIEGTNIRKKNHQLE